MKKTIHNFLAISLILLFAASCDDGFDDLNTNKVSPTSIDPAFILNNASIGLSFPGGSLVYDVGIVQYIISPNSGVLTGANYNQDNRNSTAGMWVDDFRSVIRHTRDVIARTEGVPDRRSSGTK